MLCQSKWIFQWISEWQMRRHTVLNLEPGGTIFAYGCRLLNDYDTNMPTITLIILTSDKVRSPWLTTTVNLSSSVWSKILYALGEKITPFKIATVLRFPISFPSCARHYHKIETKGFSSHFHATCVSWQICRMKWRQNAFAPHFDATRPNSSRADARTL